MSDPGVQAAAGEAEVRLLFFSSGGERFAVDVAYVREILPGQTVTPVPFVPESVAGVINYRGLIYTLLHFGVLARLGADRAPEVVLLRLPEMAVGFTVGGVEGIARVPIRCLTAIGEGGAVAEVPFLRRIADTGGRLVHLVDAEKLLDTIYQLPDLSRSGEN